MIHARVYIRDMRNVNNVTTLEQLAQNFTSLFEHRVFRLETLDYYDAENEREPYARFLAGESVDPAWRRPWQELVRGVRASGRVMQRVQIVTEPLSDYIRFSLLHAKPYNVEAGEDVRILNRAAASTANLLRCDYWLFDDDLAAVLLYDDAGRVERVALQNSEDVPVWLGTIRDEALRLSVPLAQYVAEHNITERMHAA